MQFAVQLPDQHGLFHLARAAGDRRSAVNLRATKPTRNEALKYYRKVAEHYALEMWLYELVERVDGSDGRFVVRTRTANGTTGQYLARKVVIATDYYDLPNRLDVPGENLPHVSHYYTEPHPYWKKDVVVIGGDNSRLKMVSPLSCSCSSSGKSASGKETKQERASR